MPILPTRPEGMPGLRVTSVQCSPPSVDLNRPLPGPPLDIWFSLRYASHIAAYMMFGFVSSISMSTAPVAGPRSRTLRHVAPPSVDLYTPRSSLLRRYCPESAMKTMFGAVGWMRILEIASEFLNPTCVQVLPASVGL